MKTFLVLAIAMLAACGGAEQTATSPVDILNGSPVVADETIQAVIAATQAIAQSEIDLDGYTLTVFDSVEGSHEACSKFSGESAVGCTVISTKEIDTPWPVEFSGYDRATLNAISAAVIAHELGHVYYFQTTGDPDATHSHDEWFNKDDATSVAGRVYDQFNHAN